MADATATVSLAALHTAGERIRDAINFENISIASASRNLTTRTGLFMCIDILVSWVETDTTITNQSCNYILTNANKLRINLCAVKMLQMGHEEVDNRELRLMLTRLLMELQACYKERRAEDKHLCLIRKVESTKLSLHSECCGRVNVAPLDLTQLSFEDDDVSFAGTDEADAGPEAQSLDALMLELGDIIEKCSLDPQIAACDAVFLINDRVLGWTKSLSRRSTEYTKSDVSSSKVSIAYDITTLYSFIARYMADIKQEHDVSLESAASAASCRVFAATKSTNVTGTCTSRICAQCVQS